MILFNCAEAFHQLNKEVRLNNTGNGGNDRLLQNLGKLVKTELLAQHPSRRDFVAGVIGSGLVLTLPPIFEAGATSGPQARQTEYLHTRLKPSSRVDIDALLKDAFHASRPTLRQSRGTHREGSMLSRPMPADPFQRAVADSVYKASVSMNWSPVEMAFSFFEDLLGLDLDHYQVNDVGTNSDDITQDPIWKEKRANELLEELFAEEELRNAQFLDFTVEEVISGEGQDEARETEKETDALIERLEQVQENDEDKSPGTNDK